MLLKLVSHLILTTRCQLVAGLTLAWTTHAHLYGWFDLLRIEARVQTVLLMGYLTVIEAATMVLPHFFPVSPRSNAFISEEFILICLLDLESFLESFLYLLILLHELLLDEVLLLLDAHLLANRRS